MRDWIEMMYEESIFLDGFDDEIDGVTLNGVVVYKINKIIERLMHSNSWTYEEAEEWFDFNIANSYMGEFTPILVETEG